MRRSSLDNFLVIMSYTIAAGSLNSAMQHDNCYYYHKFSLLLYFEEIWTEQLSHSKYSPNQRNYVL